LRKKIKLKKLNSTQFQSLGTSIILKIIIIWSTGSSDTAISNLCAGYYSFTLTDAHSCSKVDSIEITEPPLLEDTVYIVDTIRCFGYDSATAVIVASGGTPPYTYTTPVGNSDTMSNIGAGWYVFQITDSNGCQITDSVEITQPDSVVITFTDVNIIPCAGICTGHATVNVSGGTAPYDYVWSNGDSSITADSLCGGYAVVTIVDANGCVYNDSVAIIDTSDLQVNVDSIILPTCYGDCNGSIVVSGSGGFPPYTYQWDTTAGSATTDSVGGLCAGDYVVTITDDSGCYVIDTISLSNPPALSILLDSNITQHLMVCYQECNGALGVIVNNGTSPYQYQWNFDSTLNVPYVDSLCAGNYSLTVTDANGCTATFDTSVISDPEIVVDFDVTNPLCEYGSADGNIIANVSGGTIPYFYNWNTGDTVNQLMGLDGGTYYLTVTDSLGCTQVDSVFLNPQILVVARADTDTTICPGDTVMIYGYTNGERFEWSPTTNMIDSTTLTPLVFPEDTTIYYFTAYDTICYNWDSVVVNVYAKMNIDAGEDVEIMQDHSTQLQVSGGHDGCTYHWMPSDGLSNDTISNPVASPDETTMYYVVVTDEHGCSEIDSVKVTVIPHLVIPNGITPNGDGINDVWVIDNIDKFPNVEVEIYNRWGELLFYSKGYPPSERWDGTYKGKKLPTGTYYYVIKLNDPILTEPITGPITIMY
jgi:gliding motility-associated-like protein